MTSVKYIYGGTVGMNALTRWEKWFGVRLWD